MYRRYIRENVTLTATILFIIIFYIIQLAKPHFIYNKDGSLRQFGIGYKNKTIFPVWLLSIILGIICYLAVNCYIKFNL